LIDRVIHNRFRRSTLNCLLMDKVLVAVPAQGRDRLQAPCHRLFQGKWI
jgi:hypothetical protein